jgi:hypothetical protein
MQRRYCSAVVALLATLLLSSAVGVSYVNVDGTTNEPAPLATGAPADAGYGVPPGQPPTDVTSVTISAGTSNNSWPWATTLGTSMRFQMLYLASEIGRSGRITWFAFQNGTNLQRTFNSVVIKMCHTNITAVQATNMDANYGGSTPDTFYQAANRLIGTGVVDGWDSIPGDFYYNGTDNLLVEVVWNTAGSGSNITSRFGSRSPARRTWVWNWQGNVGVSADASLYNARFTFQDNDVGVSKLIAPTGTVDSGTVVTPACSVYNYGGQAATYQVRLKIGSYTDSATVTAHPPSTAQYVTFADWTALQRGTSAVSCSTELTGDGDASNNRKTDSVKVVIKDVGLVSIAVPTGTYPRDTAIRCKATWRNYGTQAATFEAWALLSNPTDARVYAQKVDVPNLSVGGSIEVGTFPPCTLRVAGNWTVRCSTFLTGDSKPANDTLDRAFTVGRLDMAVRAILAPAGSFDTAVAVTPTARVKNLGDAPATDVKVFFRIDSTPGNIVYRDSVTRTFAAGESANVAFVMWPKPHIPRAYSARCSAFVAGDPAGANNVLSAQFIVTAGAPPPPGAWTAKTQMPAGAKAIKDGGWLAYDAGKARVFASRGQKQPDFWAYAPTGDSWGLRAQWLPGTEGKLPQKGSVGCADGDGHVYATKGNNTSGFWMYDANANTWIQKRDVPLGLSNKKVKGGTDIVWAYKGSVGSPYLLKGYKNEFYRYNVARDSWQTLPPAPIGASAKWDKGSWLGYQNGDDPPFIYAFKAKYMELYRYNTETDSWSTALAPMPIAGSAGSKKAKDGSCAARGHTVGEGEVIWGLKGGNTREFWKYTIATNAWAEKETIPTGTMKKKVKAGADIVAVGDVLYATKGNKSNEFWMYTPSTFVFEAPRHDGVVAGRMASGEWRMAIAPNPLTSGFAVLRYGLPKAGAAELSIYSVTGQKVMTQTLAAGRSGIVNLDLRHLSNGVYLVKLSSEGFAGSQKFVVQR